MGLLLVGSIALFQLWVLIGLGAGLGRLMRFAPPRAPFLVWAWTGFAAIVVGAQLAHLFLPLNGWLPWVATPLAGLGWWRAGPRLALRSLRELSAATWLALGLLFLGLCFAALAPATARDNGLYFIQSTLWARDFPAVPGIGNLHPCLANNHAYFLWVATWALGPVKEQPWIVSNVALLWLAGAPGAVVLVRWLASREVRDDVAEVVSVFALGPILDCGLSGMVSSPVADLALAATQAAMMTWLVTWSERTPAPDEATVMAWVFAATASVKVAGAMAAIVCWAAAMWSLRRHPRHALAALVGCAVIGASWVAHGYVQSGYPLFPFPMGGAPVDWRVPEAVARAFSLVGYSQHHALTWYDRSGYVPSDWPLKWISHYWLENRDVLAPALLLIGGTLAAIVGALRGRWAAQQRFATAAVAAVVMWFVVAPEPRFAELTLWGAGAGTAAWAFPATNRWRGGLTLIAGVLVVAWSFLIAPLPTFRTEPAPREPWTGDVYELKGGGTVFTSTRRGCLELPCALCPYPSLQFRKPVELRSGFKRDPADWQFVECDGQKPNWNADRPQ